MTKPSDRTIRELTAELYDRFNCAEAPRAKTAKLLEQIDLAADQLAQDRDEAQARCEKLHRAYLAAMGVQPNDLPD